MLPQNRLQAIPQIKTMEKTDFKQSTEGQRCGFGRVLAWHTGGEEESKPNASDKESYLK